MDQNQQSNILKIKILKILKLCLKSWKLFTACICGCMLLAGAYLWYRSAYFEVDAQLMIPNETSGGNMFSLGDLASSFNIGDMFGISSTENEISVMRSHTVFLNTVKEMGLNVGYYEKTKLIKWVPSQQYHQLVLTADPSLGDTIRTGLLFDVTLKSNGNFDIDVIAKKKKIVRIKDTALPAPIATHYGQFLLDKSAYFGTSEDEITRFRIMFMSYNYAAQSYAQSVRVFTPNKKTDFIALAYITNDPEFGKGLLSSIIDNYNLLYNTQKNDKSMRTLDFIDTRISSLSQELSATESEMEAFKKSHNITDPSVDAAQALEANSRTENTLFWANMENEILNMTYDFLTNPENNYSLIPNLVTGGAAVSAEQSPATAEIDSYNDLIMRHIRLSKTVAPSHAQLKLLEEQIDAMRANIITTIEQALNNSKLKIRELSKQRNKAANRMGTIPTLEKEYVNLERKLVLQQQLYLFLLKQKEEASMSLSKISPSLITIDEPYTLIDKPGLSAKIVLAAAFLFGCFLPLLFVYFFKLGRAPFSCADEIEDAVKAPMAGSLASDGSNHGLPVVLASNGESLRQLRANVQFLLDGFAGNVVMVASDLAGEGRTYAASNLAAGLALQGRNALIVDCDLSNHGVSKVFGLSANEPGVAEIALSGANPTAMVKKVPVGAQTLSVLPGGNLGSGNQSDIIGSPAVASAISALSDAYDYIVIDTPALSGDSSAFLLAESVDLTLYVLRVGLSNEAQSNRCNELFEAGRLPRLAVVANQG